MWKHNRNDVPTDYENGTGHETPQTAILLGTLPRAENRLLPLLSHLGSPSVNTARVHRSIVTPEFCLGKTLAHAINVEPRREEIN